MSVKFPPVFGPALSTNEEDFRERNDIIALIGFNMSDAERPERTREHYIEALGRNHAEQFVFLQGHVADEPRPDCGYDLVITTFDYKGSTDYTGGEVENGSIYVQLKSTDKLKVGRKHSTQISFSVKRRHVVYWLHMQSHLKSSRFTLPAASQEKIVVHLSTNNVVDKDAIRTFRQYKTDVLKQIEGLKLCD